MLSSNLTRNRNKLGLKNSVRLFSAKTTDTSSSDKQKTPDSLSKIKSWLSIKKGTESAVKDGKTFKLSSINEFFTNNKSLDSLKNFNNKTLDSLKNSKTLNNLKNNKRLNSIPDDITNQLNVVYANLKQIEYSNKMDAAYKSLTKESFQQSLDRYKKGAETELSDAKIWFKLWNYKYRGVYVAQNVTYEELLAKVNFARDGLKTGSIFLIPFMPFLPNAMILLPFVTPRKLVSRNFWSVKQKNLYLIQNHFERSQAYQELISHIEQHIKSNKLDKNTSSLIENITNKLNSKEVIDNSELAAVMGICHKYPFSLAESDIHFLRCLCKIYEVSSLGTAPALRSRLQDRAADILDMDTKLREMDLDKLSPEQVATAAYMRGLDAVSLPHEANLYWLKNWLSLSQSCHKGDCTFVLQAMAILSMNYTVWKYHLRVFG